MGLATAAVVGVPGFWAYAPLLGWHVAAAVLLVLNQYWQRGEADSQPVDRRV